MGKNITLHTELSVFNSADELEANDKLLLDAAKACAKHAYAPYSQFNVGAAVLLENGTIVTGNNQENAAYPSGLCAERVALFYASSQFPEQKISAIALTAFTKNKLLSQPVAPCGACRQVMAEYEVKSKKDMRIIMAAQTGEVYTCKSVSHLLPLLFSNKDLI